MPVREEEFGPALLAGVSQIHPEDDDTGISAQWRDFARHMDRIPNRVGETTFGVVRFTARGFEYTAAVEVSEYSALPQEYQRIRLPRRRYRVVTHEGERASLRATIQANSPEAAVWFVRFSDVVEVWL